VGRWAGPVLLRAAVRQAALAGLTACKPGPSRADACD
nr:hypothetical protein [Tanacetum cinerariifolium]